MTPAQQRALAVALDGLREAFGDEARAAIVRGLYDEATAARMLRAVNPIIESAIARYQRYVTGRFQEALEAARVPRGQQARRRGLEWTAVCEEIIEADARIPLLPLLSEPETSPGASAPRPQSPQGETP